MNSAALVRLSEHHTPPRHVLYPHPSRLTLLVQSGNSPIGRACLSSRAPRVPQWRPRNGSGGDDAQVRTKYVCEQCGGERPSCVGQVPGVCAAWNSLSRRSATRARWRLSSPPLRRAASSRRGSPANAAERGLGGVAGARLPTGIGEMDRVLGGGIDPGPLCGGLETRASASRPCCWRYPRPSSPNVRATASTSRRGVAPADQYASRRAWASTRAASTCSLRRMWSLVGGCTTPSGSSRCC